MSRTILIIHPGAIGDVLLSLPAIRALSEAFSGHPVGLIAGSEVGRLLRACEEIQMLFPLEGDALASLLAGPGSVSGTLREWIGRCDLVVSWMNDPAERLSSTLHGLGVACVMARSPLSTDCEAVHQTDRFLETVREIEPMWKRERSLRLPPPVIESGKARLAAVGAAGNRPLVAVHPGSGSPHKCGDPALLSRLIGWLHAHDTFPLLVSGPSDDEMLEEVLAACVTQPVFLRGLDLVSMAGVLAHATLFVGHDSGLAHVAAALHRPTIVLFGPTEPRRWAPLGSHVEVLRGEPCRCLGWEMVRACQAKPCLQIPAERLLLASGKILDRRRNHSLTSPNGSHSSCQGI